jgi:hypothetical protein
LLNTRLVQTAKTLFDPPPPQALVNGVEVSFSALLSLEESAVPYQSMHHIRRADGGVVFCAASPSGHARSAGSCCALPVALGASPSASASPPPDGDATPELPDVLWWLIMRFCRTRELCMLARVSRGLRRAASAPCVWRERHAALFGAAPPPGSSASDAALVRRCVRRSELRAARWLEADAVQSPLGGAAVCIALDDTKAACGERDCVRVYGAPGGGDAGRKLGTLRGHTADVTCIATSDAALLSGDAGGTLRLWGADDFKLLRALRGHAGAVAACLLLPGGGPLVSGGADGTVRLWTEASPAPLALLHCDTAVRALAFDASVSAPGGAACPAHLYVGGGFIDCIDIATATRISTLVDVLDDEPTGDAGLVPVTRLAAHGPLLAAGGAAGGVSLWDVRASHRHVACIPTPGGGACGGLQLDDWKLVAAFSGDGDAVSVFDMRAALAPPSAAAAAADAVTASAMPLLRLSAGGRVAALGFCGGVLLAAVEGRPCVSWSFCAPGRDGAPLAAAVSAGGVVAPDTPDADTEASRAERRKKGVVPKVRGRYPKRSTR